MTARSSKAREIMACTRQLLTAGGYKSFSYADIAAQVDIRKASIHHHFPGKADLVKAVVVEYRNCGARYAPAPRPSGRALRPC